MCNALKPCIKNSNQDCKECFEYSKNVKKVFSPEDSFNFNGKLCDCIIECNGCYILVEIKTGKVNSEKADDIIEQLKNCQELLLKVCGKATKCYKVLIYERFNIQPPTKLKRYKDRFKAEKIDYYWLKNLRNKKLCEYILA